jgi:hypothetical protein
MSKYNLLRDEDKKSNYVYIKLTAVQSLVTLDVLHFRILYLPV